MRKGINVKIDKKKVVKKLENIAEEKNTSAYTPTTTPYTPLENSAFAQTNQNFLYNRTEKEVPYGYHKIRCKHCDNVIATPMGFSDCPKCGKQVYTDKDTVFLL